MPQRPGVFLWAPEWCAGLLEEAFMDNIRNESTSNEDMTSAVLGWTISVAMFATAIAMIWFVGTH